MTNKGLSNGEFAQGLIDACATGQLSQLQTLLEQSHNLPPASLPTPQYLLQQAAKNGQAEVVRYLFDSLSECRRSKPWDPFIPNGVAFNDIPTKWRIYEDGVIHSAIEGSDPVKIFSVFLDYGMSPDYNLERAISPLARAVSGNRLDLATFLLCRGAKPNGRYITPEYTFLGEAAGHPSPAMLNLLIKHGAQLKGSQALRQAAEYGCIRNAERLLELGADINEVFARMEWSPTREVIWGCPLHFAVKGGQLRRAVKDSQPEFVRFLLERGAKADTLDGEGKTALQNAVRDGKEDIVQVFREHGVED